MPGGAESPRDRLLSGRPGRLRVKICCIASVDEAAFAIDAGADALGLVSAMPSGPGVIDDARIEEIIRWVGGRAATVLLTSRQDADGIGAQLASARPTVVQLTDAVAPAEIRRLRAAWPDVALMQVIHVRGHDAVREAREMAALVDALLLDSGNPGATVKELGGTGRVHDWSISAAIREAVDVPVFLAGGLRPENVAEAVSTVRPFGVDVCSGLRPRGALDGAAAARFIDAARAACAAYMG